MKTKLMFRRTCKIGEESKVFTKIVTVDIPGINPGEGWTLLGHTDFVEELDVFSSNNSTEVDVTPEKAPSSPTEEHDKTVVSKFTSDVPGTAKLVRSKGKIYIVARRGKTVFNQTTRNSVCISDVAKVEFFNACREANGKTTYNFSLTPENGAIYDKWSNFMDAEFMRQLARCGKS